MKKWFRNTFAILTVLLLISYLLFYNGNLSEITIKTYAEELNERRLTEDKGVWTDTELSEAQLYVGHDNTISTTLSKNILKEICTANRGYDISKEQAINDINIFFQLVQEAYGGYYYFGGNDIFNKAKIDALSEVNQYTNDYKLSHKTLEKIISSSLQNVVCDAHFMIGSTIIVKQQYAYWVPNLYFDSEISDYSNYMKSTLTPEGDIKWAFIVLSEDNIDLPSHASINGDIIELNWVRMATQGKFNSKQYSIIYQSGIPIISARSFISNSNISSFIESGELVNSSRSIILDIRGNTGGNGNYPLLWLQNFIDELNIKAFTAQRISVPFLTYLDSSLNQYDKSYIEWFKKQDSPWITNFTNGYTTNNSCLILVLIDKNVASAAEDLVYWLKHIENVVLIGTNTSGTIICGNICTFYLPESKLKIQFGTKLNLYDGNNQLDGIGLLPDIWVEPVNALEYLLIALEK